MSVYFSVLNRLFPERAGKKYKARYCAPLDGEYVTDVDAYLVLFKHKHKVEDHWFVCEECLNMSKRFTLHLCEAIQKYDTKLAVVFSDCQGFHVHVIDFDYHDWIPYREKDPIWCHAASSSLSCYRSRPMFLIGRALCTMRLLLQILQVPV